MLDYSKIEGTKIFITGGAGFIGSYIVEELLPYNPKKIIIVDNFLRGSNANMATFASDQRVEFIEGDIRDSALLEKCIEEVDYVFHCAALRINACAADQVAGYEVMVDATFRLVELCKKHKIKKVIYSSSASVYGLAQNFPTPESDNPYDNQTFYGAAKMWGEGLFRSYKFMHDLDYVGFRYFNAYGPRMDTDGRYTEVMIKWLDCIRDNKVPLIYGDGSDSMDFVYVRDIAKANVAGMVADVTDEVFNIGNCVETNLNELCSTLLKVNKSDLKPDYRDVNTVNPVSRRLADISKARRLLEFEPSTDLEAGLSELTHWYFKKQKQSV